MTDGRTARKTAYYGFTDLISPESATRIASAFNEAVNNNYENVYLCLSSYGGTVADGVYLYNYITGLPLNVIIHNIGTVASAATVVYVAADERRCSKHGIFLFHPTHMSIQNDMRAEALDSALKTALSDDERTENILRERCPSFPPDTLSARRYRDVFVTPESATEFGLAHSCSEFSLPEGDEIFQI